MVLVIERGHLACRARELVVGVKTVGSSYDTKDNNTFHTDRRCCERKTFPCRKVGLSPFERVIDLCEADGDKTGIR